MRKLIALLMMGAMCVILFAPPVLALKDDPNRLRPWDYNQDVPTYGDDGSWGDPTQGGRNYPDANENRSMVYEKRTLYNFLLIKTLDIFINLQIRQTSQWSPWEPVEDNNVRDFK